MKRGFGRVVAIAAATTLLFAAGVTTAFATLAGSTSARASFEVYGSVPTGNLITNPDAEAGEGSMVLPEGSVVPIPGWQTTSNFTVIKYGVGGFPSVAAGVAISGGANFFGGGPSNAASSAAQTIDLAGSAGAIDAGTVTATLAAHMGGFLGQGDKGPVDAIFLGAAGEELGRLTLAAVFPAERSGLTILIARNASGDVPAGTRSIRVVMTAVRATGSSNDTYFDNLSLTLEAPPPAETTETTETTQTTETTDTTQTEADEEPVDLSVSISDNPDPVGVDELLTYSIDVTNVGAVNATGVVLSSSLPPGTDFVSAVILRDDSVEEDCLAGEGGVECAIGEVGAEGSASVRVVVRPREAGEIQLTASVTSVEPDSNGEDNVAAEGTTVEATDATPCAPAVCIDNGTVLLAVHPTGQLNVEDGTGSKAGPGDVGLHFLPTGNDGTSPGCLCEGWGAADAGTGASGWANEDSGGAHNLTLESFTSTASTAVSTVRVGETLRVTHDYHPSPDTANLYEVTVTIENITGGALSDIRYRRTMDWDIEPTAFAEFVTIDGGNATQLLFDSNDGFAASDPLAGPSDLGQTGNFTDAGPSDHGALFDFGFGALGPGEKTSFNIFYGAAADEDSADVALAASGAEVFSYGQPSSSEPTVGTPNTFIFAFRGVGGDPIFAPEAVDDAVVTDEDVAKTFNVLVNDTDQDEDPLTVTGTTSPAHGSVTCAPNGDCTYGPNPNYNGPDSFTYTISDGSATDTATVNVTVSAVNDPPNAVDDTLTTDEDTAGVVNVLANDTDPDGDSLAVTEWSDPPNGTVVCTDAGSCTYTPDAGYSGPDTFSYGNSDGNGGNDVATVNVTVNPANDQPNAVDDEATTDEDQAVEVDVLANDTDPESEVLEVTGKTDGAHGTVVCPETSCTYTPEANFHGADSFTYTVREGDGGTDTATVRVTVRPVNDDPEAEDDNLATDEGAAAAVNVLANDTDVDGDSLSVTGESDGAHGSATCTPAGACTYTPDAGYSGPDSFTYDISDGNGGTDSAGVSVTVNAVNHAPDAIDNTLTTNEDTAGSVNVLANDSDPDEDPLTVTGASGVAHGSVMCATDGVCTYTPQAGYFGPDSFTYTIADGRGGTDTATVNVTVNPVNDPPNAVDDALATIQGAAATLNVLANDTDPDGDALSAGTPVDGDHGTVSCTPAGACTYTPEAGYSGPDTFTYVVSDGHGGSDIGTVGVLISAAAPASQPPASPPPPAPPPAPPLTGLVLTMSVSPQNPAIGDVVTFTARIDNQGSASVPGVTFVNEVTQEGASFVSVDTTQGSCSGATTVICALGTVDRPVGTPGGGFSNASSVTVVHRVRVTSAGDVSSTATLQGSNAVGSRRTTTVSVSATPTVPRTTSTPGPIDDGIPNLNQTVVIEPVEGEILVRLPGTSQFVPLSSLRELPNGTEVDATNGRLRLTVATEGGGTTTADFYDGIFTVNQQAPSAVRMGGGGTPAGITELRLTRGDFSSCTAKPAAVKTKAKKKPKAKKKRKPAAVEAKPRKPIRRLWGDGSGDFRTRGRYGVATVRGTVWLTEDYCNGTLIKVQEGAVTVRDLVRNRTVTVTAGKSYFAETPAPKAAKAKAKPKKKATKKRKPAAGR